MGVLVSQGQDANTYDPAGLLDFGQTYYWRVDEVNAPPDSTLYQGRGLELHGRALWLSDHNADHGHGLQLQQCPDRA